MHLYNATCGIINSIPKFAKKGEKTKAINVKDFIGSFEDYMNDSVSQSKDTSESLYLKALLIFPDTSEPIRIAKD